MFSLTRQVYEDLVSQGVIVPKEEVAPPTVPMDYNWARVSSGYRRLVILSVPYQVRNIDIVFC